MRRLTRELIEYCFERSGEPDWNELAKLMMGEPVGYYEASYAHDVAMLVLTTGDPPRGPNEGRYYENCQA